MTTLAEDLAERFSPVTVKEVRQGLRAKVFVVFFSVLLVGCLLAALTAFASIHQGVHVDGADLLAAYLVALGVVGHFVVPFVAFRSMVREREDETWVLLTLTGLSSASIVRGKWTSALSQTLLYASACAPFVLFSYYLNGVDLVQVLLGLLMVLSVSALANALAVAIASQAITRLGRTLAHFVTLGALALLTLLIAGLSVALAKSGGRLLDHEAQRNGVLGVVLFGGLLAWLLLEGAAASMVLPSQSLAWRPRLALGVVNVAALGFYAVAAVSSSGRSRELALGQVLLCFFLVVAGVFCVSEADGAVRFEVHTGWRRSGARRSFLVIQGLLGLSALVGLVLVVGLGDADTRGLQVTLGAALYPSLYLSLAVLLGRLSPLRALGEPRATRVGFLFAVALGTVGSLVLSLLFTHRPDDTAANFLNPLVGLVNLIDHSWRMQPALFMLLLVAGLIGAWALAVLTERDRVRA